MAFITPPAATTHPHPNPNPTPLPPLTTTTPNFLKQLDTFTIILIGLVVCFN
jgi:hypothetical protein